MKMPVWTANVAVERDELNFLIQHTADELRIAQTQRYGGELSQARIDFLIALQRKLLKASGSILQIS